MSDDIGDGLLFQSILQTLRRSLYACPEGAGVESTTASLVTSFVSAYQPDAILTGLGGGHGMCAIFEASEAGPTVAVRADLDAVPIERNESLEQVAQPADEVTLGFPAVATRFEHRCGHDAHMTMVAALAALVRREPLPRGRLALVFQPAEETGEGAAQILMDPRFQVLAPDFTVGLHNLPGEAKGAIVVRAGTMACASVGLQIDLHGLAAHAAEPELGVSPLPAVQALLTDLPGLRRAEPGDDDYRLVTITHVDVGRPTYGVSPGHARIRCTLRAATSEGLQALRVAATESVSERAREARLVDQVQWHDEFPSTLNAAELVDTLEQVAAGLKLPLVRRSEPMRWSDDFGHFSRVSPSLYFGLGIGEQAVGLHQEGYAFPEELLVVGAEVLHEVARALLRRD
ncbi:MAG: amidohydrolase [Myxococcota bacterium]